MQAAARANGTVTFTVATYDYAEGAMLWYNDIFSKVSYHGDCVTVVVVGNLIVGYKPHIHE
jgi:hypothetical protein